MKRLALAVLMLGVFSICRAEVVGTIISTKIDDNGNIEVHTQYVQDGREITP